MRFVIVTGMSGAGKSTALKMLEDAEYFCVDNLPIPLVEKFAQLTADGTSGEIQKVAVGIWPAIAAARVPSLLEYLKM